MTNHSEEIMFLNRPVEDLKSVLEVSMTSGGANLAEFEIGAHRLNQATEAIARLEKQVRNRSIPEIRIGTMDGACERDHDPLDQSVGPL